MKESELTDFAKMLTGVAELYGKKISAALLNIYWAALNRFDFVDVRQGINRHVNNVDVGQFMPKPADIIRNLEGDSETHALKAWSKVESAIRKIGSYDTVVFDDPLIHVVIADMGGWPKMCAILTKDMPFRASEFMKRYQASYHTRQAQCPAFLAGRVAQCNRTTGDTNTVPILVGDERLALTVLRSSSDSYGTSIHRHSQLVVDFLNKSCPSDQLTFDKKDHEEKHHES